VDGRALKLNRTGAARREVYFVQEGSRMRCRMGVRYAKFLIGRYAILPIGSFIPAAWRHTIDGIVRAVREGQ
jgi:hypothetical protein